MFMMSRRALAQRVCEDENKDHHKTLFNEQDEELKPLELSFQTQKQSFLPPPMGKLTS